MINLFIDANIYLNFYKLDPEHLGRLKLLLDLVGKNEIKLFATDLVIDEVYRNREKVIGKTLNKFFSLATVVQMPEVYGSYGEIKEINRYFYKIKRLTTSMLSKVKNDIKGKNLEADWLIGNIFSASKIIKTTDEIFSLAKRRIDIGNPPGKNLTYCDAVNWEGLLENVPHGEELTMITYDRDYMSPLAFLDLNLFLFDEWQKRKSSRIFFYNLLSGFLLEKFSEETGVKYEHMKRERDGLEGKDEKLPDFYLDFSKGK